MKKNKKKIRNLTAQFINSESVDKTAKTILSELKIHDKLLKKAKNKL